MKKIILFAMLAMLLTGCAQSTAANFESGTVTTESTITEITETSQTEILESTESDTADSSSATASAPDVSVTTTTIATQAPVTTTTSKAAPPATTAPQTTRVAQTALPAQTAPVVKVPAAPAPQVSSAPVTTTPAPVITTPATTASVPASSSATFQQQVVDLVNAERAKGGLNPLTVSQEVQNAAQVRAGEIIQSFSHTRPNGASPFTALNEQNLKYTAAGENIAAGQATPQAVMDSWMNSSGHRANIMNPDFTHIGVGYIEGGGYKTNWVQLFARM